MLPRVIMHNAVSLDGRIDWFTPDIGLYYEIASRFGADIHLAGSGTLVAQQEEAPPEEEDDFQPPEVEPGDTRPLLVVPDSRGRVRNWPALRKAGIWRGMLALCSQSTPKNYLDYLKKRHVEYLIAGETQVDLRKALEELSKSYGAKTVLLDSGGTLNGVLLRTGLVNEVSLLVSPCLVGGASQRSFFRAEDLTTSEGIIQLKLTHLEKLKDKIVWLRYDVEGGK